YELTEHDRQKRNADDHHDEAELGSHATKPRDPLDQGFEVTGEPRAAERGCRRSDERDADLNGCEELLGLSAELAHRPGAAITPLDEWKQSRALDANDCDFGPGEHPIQQ